MGDRMEALYQERLARYAAALRNEQPDRVPIRPFVAEFTAAYAGYTCQQVTHDYALAFEAACKTAAGFDWDAVVPNMVYVWTGLSEAIGLRYYGAPGIAVPPNTGFQYLEPHESDPFMRADEYDALAEDPTGFLYNVWLPRAARAVCAPGAPCTYANQLSFVRGGMAMLQYFTAFGPQIERLRRECGMPSAIAGIFKAPLDILGDKLRGYMGLTEDLMTQPDKVHRACEALMPHLMHVALTTADPEKRVPIGFWLHRGCVPFITPGQFADHYWPTLKPIIEELWSRGHQTLFYAEGNWDAHLEAFAELPDRSMVFHIDRSDPAKAHAALGDRFCLSGGVPNAMMAYGTPDQVRAQCKKLIDGLARDGGYIMDASAILQNDAKPENVRAMTEFTREYGAYSGAAYTPDPAPPARNPPARRAPFPPSATAAGVCVPWEVQRAAYPEIKGDEAIVRRIWESTDALANMYIWQLLLSF